MNVSLPSANLPAGGSGRLADERFGGIPGLLKRGLDIFAATEEWNTKDALLVRLRPIPRPPIPRVNVDTFQWLTGVIDDDASQFSHAHVGRPLDLCVGEGWHADLDTVRDDHNIDLVIVSDGGYDAQ